MSGRYNNQWKRLLSVSDRKLQTAEIEDIQTIINNNVKDNFNYLYYFYDVVKGLIPEVKVVGEEFSTINCSSGQVFVTINNQSYFVDIDSFELTLPVIRPPLPNGFMPENYTKVGVLFQISDIDSVEYNDPNLQYISQTPGAGRRVISYQITIDNDNAYPLFVVQSQGQSTKPILLSYRSQVLTRDPSNELIPKKLEKSIQRYFYEEQGNFISSGMNISGSLTSRTVSIQPGEAFIKGSYKLLNYPLVVSIPDIPDNSEYVFAVQITKDLIPTIDIYQTQSAQFIPLDSEYGDLIVGYIIASRSSPERWTVLQSTNRAYSNSSLLNLIQQNIENVRSLADIVLANQTANAAYSQGIRITGTFVEAFNTLSNSDFNSIEFSASLDTQNSRLYHGSSNLILSLLNANILDSQTANIKTNNLLPYYISPKLSKQILLTQERVTSSIQLNRFKTTVQSTTLIPNVVYADPQTNGFKAQFNPSSDSEDLQLLEIPIYVKVSGLPAFADNLVPRFDSTVINNVTVLGLTKLGSTLGSLRADEDGVVEFQFNIPPNTPAASKTISLSSPTINSNSTLYYKPYSESRFCPEDQTSINSALYQTFLTTTPVVITEVGIKIKSLLPSITTANLKILELSICELSNGAPTRVLGKTTINLGDVKQSATGSLWTYKELDFPAILENPKTYCLTVSPLVSGVEVWTADSSLPDINTQSRGSISRVFEGQLFSYEEPSWREITNNDLCFSLISSTASNSTSTVEFRLANPLENFSNVLYSLPKRTPGSTSIDLFYKEPNSQVYIAARSNNIKFQDNIPHIDIRINFNSTNNLFPILDSSATWFILKSPNEVSSWISRSYDSGTSYTNAEVELSYYLPRGNDISVSISSNDGETWDALTGPTNPTDSFFLVDGNIPLYRSSFSSTSLSTTVVSNRTGQRTFITRRSVRIRVTLTSTNSLTQPYISQLSTITY
jgi:hypothetical protein